MSLLDRIKREEGFVAHAYNDSKGILTIGYGFNIDPRGPGLAEDEASAVLELKVGKVRSSLALHLPFFSNLDPVRQDVLVDMAYNMGEFGLIGFHNTLSFIEKGDYLSAAQAMLNSKWHGDVGHRAEDLAQMMRTGEAL